MGREKSIKGGEKYYIYILSVLININDIPQKYFSPPLMLFSRPMKLDFSPGNNSLPSPLTLSAFLKRKRKCDP